jgi:hypothetical protein
MNDPVSRFCRDGMRGSQICTMIEMAAASASGPELGWQLKLVAVFTPASGKSDTDAQ